MTNKKGERTSSKASKRGCSGAEGSREKLAEDFLAYLIRSLDRHGSEIFDRVWAEQPKLYFKAMVELAQIESFGLSDPRDFDRQRNREEVLQRLGQRIG
jgi:hypothetical protein